MKVSLQLCPLCLEAATLLICWHSFPKVLNTSGCFVFTWGRWQVEGPLYWGGRGVSGGKGESGVMACWVELPPATWAPLS